MAIVKHTTYETWTVQELMDATSQKPAANKQVTIPEFQRRLVWTKSKQDGLLDSIRKGFPIGTLLLYREPGVDEKYKFST